MGNAQQITSGSSCINVNTIGSGNTINIGAAKLPLLPIATLTPPIAERSAALLAPQAFLVQKLIGRDDILAKLKSWLFESEHKVSFCVLTGEGGAGKTRLAMHLCRKAFGQCDAKGKPRWDVGLLKGHAVRAAGENLLCGPAALQKPTLAVIDYAAPFAGGINKLLEALLSHEAALQHPLRLVLLERYADRETGWLQSVLGRGNSTAHTLPERMLDAGPIRLQPLQEAGERRRMVEETLRALESKRLAEVCDAGEAVDQRLREAPWGGQPLYLMMFAFAVDQHGLSYALRLGKKDLLRAQAKRELNRVALFSEDKATQTILEQMTAVATLCNGIARQDLVDAVGGELQHLQLTVNGGPGAVADLLELALPRLTTTPENRPEITGMAPILPDPVGSMALLLRLSLCRNPEPTLLAAHDKTPLAVLQTLLRCVLDVYDRDDTKTHVVLKWLEYAAEAETNLEMLIALGNSLPEQHTALAKFSMSITKSMMEILRAQPEPDLPRLATNLNNLSVRFSNLGRKSEALEPAQEAMGIYRTLAEQMPEAFLPDLAMSLNNLATMLAELGRKSEALEPAQEAVDSYRTLAAQMPEAYLPDLAGSLNNLAIRLSDLGRKIEALEPAQQAVNIRRTLAEQMPEVYLPDLAGSLNNLANRLADLGQKREALEPAQQAVDIRRTLAEQMPEAFLPDLAMSLNNLAIRLAELGKKREALEPAQEAVDIRRTLAEQMPEAFLPDLAMSLNNLAGRLADLGRKSEALGPAQQAVDIRRTLAEQMPEAFLPYLAASLNNLANILSDLGQKREALKPAQQAMGIYRTLAEQMPEAFLPDLAMSLNNLAGRLADLGQKHEALEPAQEAVDSYRTLAEQRPDAYLSYLATSLNNLAGRLADLGQKREALEAAQEAVDIRRTLAEQMPEAYLPDLAASLNNLATMLAETGQKREALGLAQEAVVILSPFFLALPLAYAQWMRIMRDNYIMRCEENKTEPDLELLAPIAVVFQQLQEQSEE